VRPGPGGLIGNGWEVLRVTYTSGDVEVFTEAESTNLGDRNSATLLVQDANRRLLATLTLVNVRKWEWVPAEDGAR